MFTRFLIKHLHGNRSYDIEFDSDTMILVGENGSGKTSVLRILYYTISGQWDLLADYSFDYIEVCYEGACVRINSDDVRKIDSKMYRRYSPQLRKRLHMAMSEINMLPRQ